MFWMITTDLATPVDVIIAVATPVDVIIAVATPVDVIIVMMALTA
jgi:hypothetical protein